MKCLLMLFSIALVQQPSVRWFNDFDTAVKAAKDDRKFILLNFSGSDWCGPCIRLKKEIFDAPGFQDYATKNLVLINADFPRMKKNALPKTQQDKNDQMADRYNKAGAFPLTVLLDSEGKVLKTWEGFPNINADVFVAQLESVIHSKN